MSQAPVQLSLPLSSSPASPVSGSECRPLELDLDLTALPDPFPVLIEHIARLEGPPPATSELAWLLPRVEQAGALRAALAAGSMSFPHRAFVPGGAAELAHSVPERFSVSPVIVTADRLSDHAGSVQWLQLRMQAFEALGNVPELTAQARSASQRWALADEYLTLAHACVATDGQRTVQDLAQANPLAGPEARIVLTLAQVFHEELLALQAPAPEHPAWDRMQGIVWLDDGDPAAGRWLKRHAAHRPVYRVRLVSMEHDPPVSFPQSGSVRADAGARNGGQAKNGGQATVGAHEQAGAQTVVPQVHLLAAAQADAAAHMAASQIMEWLRDNPDQTIGVAVVDRLLARRVRSLLESAGVLADDRTGWRLSTTRLAGWLDALLRGWFNQDWTLWLAAMEPARIPLLTGELAGALRVRWVKRAASRPLDTTWDSLRADALVLAGEMADAQVRQPVDELLAAFDAYGTADRSLSAWATDTLLLLERLGTVAALQSDSAGSSLLVLLRGLARGGLENQCNASFFLLVLASQMESVRFRPQDVSSPVRFMPLLSFRLQRFERVMVLGVARRHFMPSPPGLLPPSVAGELGLADPWLQRAQALWALSELLRHAPFCSLVHQTQSDGQPDPLLGWLRALGLQRRVSGNADWVCLPAIRQRTVQRSVSEPLVAGGLPPPASLPVRALADLSVCPLKFVLSELADLADLQPGVPDNRSALLRGLWIHNVLERLWRDVGVPLDACGEQQWAEKLETALSTAWLALSPALRSFLFAEKLEFERTVPKLARLLAARHAQGWRVHMQEEPLRASLCFDPQHEPVTVHGRMDRLERNGQSVAIVDIKTGSVSTLQARARQWLQYPQLPLYAWMLDADCDALEYLAVRGDSPAYIPLAGDSPGQMARQASAHLADMLASLFVRAQQAHPQPGDECRYCDHAGTCRTHWLNGGAA